MHFDSLEPRRHFAVGLDPTFGTAGSVRLSGLVGARYGDQVLAARGATFAEVNVGRETFIAKYTDAGRLDASWGNKGYTKAVGNLTAMAYDASSGLLYVANTAAGTAQVKVQRFRANGRLDANWGSDNADHVVAYAPGGDIPGKQFGTIEVQGMQAAPNGRVIIAVKRQNHLLPPDNASFYDNGTVTEDVALIELQPTGRDSNFASHGVLTLLGGASAERVYDNATASDGVYVNITDFAPNAAGGFEVVITRQNGGFSYDTTGGVARLRDQTGEMTVKSRSVSARGIVDEKRAFSWTVQAKTQGDGFIPLLAAGDGHGSVTLIGNRTIDYAAGGQFAYTLSPGVRPTAVPFAVNGAIATAVTHDDDGYFYATTTSPVVTKLNGRLRPFTSFGVRGTARVGDEIRAFIPDPDGRVLAIAGTSITRLV